MNDASQTVTLLDPDGNQVVGPASGMQNALSAGYKLASPENIATIADQQKYGTGALNVAKAFGAGALRGATLNLSDPILTHLGLASPQTLAGLEQYNPSASLVGQMAGTGAALLVPGEDALTAADLINPVKAVAKLGAKIGEGVGGLLPEAGAGLGSRILAGTGQVGAKGLGSAIEGGFYGLGNTATEAALGDPDQAAEHLLANVGYGALLGGGLGSTVEAGRLVVPKSLELAQGALSKAWRTVWGDAKEAGKAPAFYDLGNAPAGIVPPPIPEDEIPGKAGIIPSLMAKVNARLTGAPEDATLDAFSGRAATGEILSPAERASFQKDLGDAIQETYNKTERALSDAVSKVRPQEVETLLSGAEPAPAQAEFQRLQTTFDHTIAEMKNRPAIYPAHFAANLEQIQEEMLDHVHQDATAADYFRAINEAKQAVDSKLPWGADPSGATKAAVALTKDLRSGLRNSLEDANVWGEAGARQAAFNNSYAAFKNVTGKKSPFRTLFMKQTNTPSGNTAWKVNQNKLNQFMNTINDPRGAERADALRDLFKASHDAIGEIDNTYKNAPFESFDKAAHESLIQKNIDIAGRAQRIVAQQPNMGYGGLGNLVTMGMAAHFGGPFAAALTMGKALSKGSLNPEVVTAKLANIERAMQKTSKVITDGTKVIINGGSGMAQKLKGPVVQALLGHKELTEELHSLHTNPEHLIDHMTAQTDPVHDAAPNIAQSLNVAAMRATNFLASKAPVTTAPGFFAEPEEASNAEIGTFNLYRQIVDNPLSILGQIQDGTLTSQGMEAIQTVYPKIYSDMQTSLLDALTAIKDRSMLPYQTRLMISQFMGQPLEASLQPQQMSIVHMANAQAQIEQKPGAPKPTVGGLGKLAIGNRSATMFQQTT